MSELSEYTFHMWVSVWSICNTVEPLIVDPLRRDYSLIYLLIKERVPNRLQKRGQLLYIWSFTVYKLVLMLSKTCIWYRYKVTLVFIQVFELFNLYAIIGLNLAHCLSHSTYCHLMYCIQCTVFILANLCVYFSSITMCIL